MSSHAEWIDAVFEQMTLVYGTRFLRQWPVDTDPSKAKAAWSRQLLSLMPRSIEWGLMHLPSDPPNALQFRAICLGTPPLKPLPELPAPPADPERVRALLAPLRGPSRRSHRQWALDLEAREEAGERLSPTVRAMWRAAAPCCRVGDSELSA